MDPLLKAGNKNQQSCLTYLSFGSLQNPRHLQVDPKIICSRIKNVYGILSLVNIDIYESTSITLYLSVKEEDISFS